MSIPDLTGLLEALELEPNDEEVRDVLWLAARIGGVPSAWSPEQEADPTPAFPEPGPQPAGEPPQERDPPMTQQSVRRKGDVGGSLHLPPTGRPATQDARGAPRVQAPSATPLNRPLELVRALRPLVRRAPDDRTSVVDEDATANRIAEERLCVPVLTPAPRPWLDLALVVDGSPSMTVWYRTADALSALLTQVGAFGEVRTWTLDASASSRALRLRPAIGRRGTPRRPGELLDPQGRRAVLVFSDCTGQAWRDGSAQRALAQWAKAGPVAVLQPLPQRLWNRCAAQPVPVRIAARRPGAPNTKLGWKSRIDTPPGTVPVPVLELEPSWLTSWSQLVTARAAGGVDGMAIMVSPGAQPGEDGEAVLPPEAADFPPMERIRRFRASSSAQAYRLAVHLAAAPISLPVLRLIQNAVLPDPRPSQLAEVFLGGLLCRSEPEQSDGRRLDPDQVQYDFLPGVREALLNQLRASEALDVLDRVSKELEIRFGQGRSFPAVLVSTGVAGIELVGADSLPFARVADTVLRRLGGRYTTIADGFRAALGTEAVAADRSAAVPDDEPLVLTEPREPARPRRREPLTCPYCYDDFRVRAILFRCSGDPPRPGRRRCPLSVDERLREAFGRTDVLPPVFAANGRRQEADCPDCGTATRRRVCPHCHSDLPARFGEVKSKMIALVGARFTGKSVYIGVLLHELFHGVGERLNAAITGVDDFTRHQFTNEYEWRLYQEQSLLPPTNRGQDLNPLVFRLLTEDQRLLRQSVHETLLSFYDTAGENFISIKHAERVQKYLVGADGILLLLDPLQLRAAHAQLRRQVPLTTDTPEEPGIVVNRVTDILLRDGFPIRKPVAVVFTKMDMFWQILPPESPLRRQPPDGAAFPDSDSRAVHDQIRELLTPWRAERIERIMARYYEKWRYFGVSALGAAPTDDNRLAVPTPQPHRIADPFLWLLSEFGAFPRSSS